MKLKISPFAELDLEESIVHYNEQKEGLGIEFAESVVSTFDRIKENPNQFPKEYKEMRKAETERFPFKVLFIVKDTIGYVLGIFHTSCNPKTMKKRYNTLI